MTLRIGTRRQTEKKMHTGHFYFALTGLIVFCSTALMVVMINRCRDSGDGEEGHTRRRDMRISSKAMECENLKGAPKGALNCASTG